LTRKNLEELLKKRGVVRGGQRGKKSQPRRQKPRRTRPWVSRRDSKKKLKT